MRKTKVPRLERHPTKNVAFVRLPMPDGRRKYVYFGPADGKNVQREYDETTALWLKGEIHAEAPESAQVAPATQAVPQAKTHTTGQLFCYVPGYGEIYFGRADRQQARDQGNG
ncbi:MAG: hypothetical protein ACM359_01175 [Bacillota bacterium]